MLQHDALRLRFVTDETGWKQHLVPMETVEGFDCDNHRPLWKPSKEREIAMMELAAGLQKSLDLTNGPTLRLVMFNLGEYKPDDLLMITHHLVMDGISSGIFLEDMGIACQQLSRGEPVQLSPKTTSFKQWAGHLHAYVRSSQFARQQERSLALPWNQAGPLPLDHADGREKNTMGSHDMEIASFTPEETEFLLKELPRRYNVQPFEAILAALTQSITRWTGRPWLAINNISAGRMMDIPGMQNMDLSRTVGWLALHQLLLLKRPESDHPGQLLESIRSQWAGFPGQGYPDDLARLSPGYSAAQSLPPWVTDLRLNYGGRGGQYTSDLLRPANLFTGAPINPACREDYLLACGVSMPGKRLTCTWEYSRFCYEKTTIKRVSSDFMETLRAIGADRKGSS